MHFSKVYILTADRQIKGRAFPRLQIILCNAVDRPTQICPPYFANRQLIFIDLNMRVVLHRDCTVYPFVIGGTFGSAGQNHSAVDLDRFRNTGGNLDICYGLWRKETLGLPLP